MLEELNLSAKVIPMAACLSTLGLDGFPNARFVSLKEVVDGKFIFTGPIQSRKGLEMENINKIALTFWWPCTSRQVRVQGLALRISPELADEYFSRRDIESCIVSVISKQGQSLSKKEFSSKKLDRLVAEFKNEKPVRPNDWGGWMVEPLRIELMKFRNDRCHERELFEWKDKIWTSSFLQP